MTDSTVASALDYCLPVAAPEAEPRSHKRERWVASVEPNDIDISFPGDRRWFPSEQSPLSASDKDREDYHFPGPATRLHEHRFSDLFALAFDKNSPNRVSARSTYWDGRLIVEVVHIDGCNEAFALAASQLADLLSVDVVDRHYQTPRSNEVVLANGIATLYSAKPWGVFKRDGFERVLEAMRAMTGWTNMSDRNLATMESNTRAVERLMIKEDFITMALEEANPDRDQGGCCDKPIDPIDSDDSAGSDDDDDDGNPARVDLVSAIPVKDRYNHMFVETRRVRDRDRNSPALMDTYTKYVRKSRTCTYLAMLVDIDTAVARSESICHVLETFLSRL
jgi:hypothetical protein